MEERRKSKRFKCILTGKVFHSLTRSEGKSFIIKDISRNGVGLSFISHTALNKADILEINIGPLEKENWVNLIVEVIRVEGIDLGGMGKRFEIGAIFRGVSEQDREKINKFIDSLENKKI